MKYKYTIRFVDGSNMTFETDINIDFHTISDRSIAFDDMYLNMKNVIYIQKQIISKGGAE